MAPDAEPRNGEVSIVKSEPQLRAPAVLAIRAAIARRRVLTAAKLAQTTPDPEAGSDSQPK